MANKTLILGEQYAITGGNQQGGFLDIAGAMQPAINRIDKIAAAQQRGRARARLLEQRKIDATNQKVGKLLANMQSNIDLEGISPEQQKNITSFLSMKKQEYIDAANMIANYDVTDPQYMEYADIMQNVNNQFVALANNLKAYKQDQAAFITDGYENRLSNSNPNNVDQAAYMYDRSTPFDISSGNLIFNYNGEKINYSEYQKPTLKAFKTADSIMQMANKIHKTKQKLSDYQKASIRLQLVDAFSQNPNALRSIVVDKLLTEDILDIDYNLYNDPSKTAELQEEVINQIIGSLEDVANKSFEASQRTNPPKKKINKVDFNASILTNAFKGEPNIIVKLYDAMSGGLKMEKSLDYKTDPDTGAFSLFDTTAGENEKNEYVIIDAEGNLGPDAARFGITDPAQIGAVVVQ